MSGIWDRDDGKTTLDDHDEWSVGATFLTIDLLIPKKPLRYSIICLGRYLHTAFLARTSCYSPNMVSSRQIAVQLVFRS